MPNETRTVCSKFITTKYRGKALTCVYQETIGEAGNHAITWFETHAGLRIADRANPSEFELTVMSWCDITREILYAYADNANPENYVVAGFAFDRHTGE